MQDNSASLGIDVASKKFDVCLLDTDGKKQHAIFENSSQGIQDCFQLLQEKNFDGSVVMESTGRYHELLALSFYTRGYQTYVINPLRVKKYQQAGIQKVKTDKQDAKLLAEMGFRPQELDRYELSPEQLAVKKKVALVRTLETKLQELRAMIKNYQESQNVLGNTLSPVEEKLKQAIGEIEKSKTLLEKEVTTEIFPVGDTKAARTKEVLTSIPGVSPYYAAMIASAYRFAPGRTPDSWLAYSGLAVSVHQSGTYTGKGRLSKRGNRYLRKRNYTAAWGAYMHSPYFKDYYNYLKDVKGRHHVEALTILGKKILRIAYHCLKNNELFNPTIVKDSLPNS